MSCGSWSKRIRLITVARSLPARNPMSSRVRLSSVAAHQLVMALDVADHQGLDNPVGPDGLSQFLQPNVLEDAPGLKGIGPDLVNRDGEGRLTRLRRRGGYGRGRRGVGTGGQVRPHSLTEGSARLFGFVHGRGSLWRA